MLRPLPDPMKPHSVSSSHLSSMASTEIHLDLAISQTQYSSQWESTQKEGRVAASSNEMFCTQFLDSINLQIFKELNYAVIKNNHAFSKYPLILKINLEGYLIILRRRGRKRKTRRSNKKEYIHTCIHTYIQLHYDTL